MKFRKFPLFVALASALLATSGCAYPCYYDGDGYCDGYYNDGYYGYHDDHHHHGYYGNHHGYYHGDYYHHNYYDGCYDHC